MPENIEEKVGEKEGKTNWREYDPRKEPGIQIFVCNVCDKHHYHLLKIGGKVYAQCGRCGEMYKF